MTSPVKVNSPKSPRNKQNDSCAVCHKICKEAPKIHKDKSIECECCLRWFHVTCVKVSVKALTALTTEQVHWFCRNCDGAAKTLYMHCTSLKSEQLRLTKVVESLAEEVKRLQAQSNTVDPDLLKTLVENEVRAQMEEAQEVTNGYVGRITSLENELDNVNTRLQALENNGSTDAVTGDSNLLNEQITDMKDAQILMDLKLDGQNQYSRRETLKISNFPEVQGENLRCVVMKVAADCGIRITGDHISVVHRNGRREKGKPRDIVCKFTIRDIKHDLLRNKHKLRRMDGYRYIYLDEHLTPLRSRIVKVLREGGAQVHTTDGKIFADGRMYDSPEDLARLLPLSQDQFIRLGLRAPED